MRNQRISMRTCGFTKSQKILLESRGYSFLVTGDLIVTPSQYSLFAWCSTFGRRQQRRLPCVLKDTCVQTKSIQSPSWCCAVLQPGVHTLPRYHSILPLGHTPPKAGQTPADGKDDFSDRPGRAPGGKVDFSPSGHPPPKDTMVSTFMMSRNPFPIVCGFTTALLVGHPDAMQTELIDS